MFLVLIGSAVSSFACSIAPPETLTVDPLLDDAVAPLAPELVNLDVRRGSAPERGLFGQQEVSSCGSGGQLVIELARPAGDTDDETTVGYRFEVVDGLAPVDFELPPAEEVWLGPVLFLDWSDGQVDEQDAFSFTLAVFPIDAAGNEGEPLEIDVADDGHTATAADCSTAPLGAGTGLLLVLPLLWCRRSATAEGRTGR